MQKSPSHMVSIRLLLVAAAFGSAALIVILGNFHIQIPGTNIVTDPREIFVLIGAGITGPIGAVVIGILSGLGDPMPEQHIYIIANHVLGALWIGWSYKMLVHDRMRMPWMLIGWAAIVFVYYYVCCIPVIAVTKYAFPEFFRVIVPKPLPFLDTLKVIYHGWNKEFVLTTMFTGAVLLVLPRTTRVPIWWTAHHPRVVESFRARPPRSILALRLTVWFLLLSCVPLVMMGLFLRHSLTNLYVEQLAGDELEILDIMTHQTSSERALMDLLRDASGRPGHALHQKFILDAGGRISWHPDSTMRNADCRALYGRKNVDDILRQSEGYLYDESSGRCFVFSRFATSPRWLVLMMDVNIGAATLESFERSTMLRFGVALVLVSWIAGIVIWLIVGRPIRTLADAARRVGRNDLQARVDPSLMSDEVGMLGEAFNEMTENLAILHQGLQREIQERRETEQALRISERRFRDMSDLLPQTVFETDTSGRLRFANLAAYEMFGFDAARSTEGLSILDCVAPVDRERLRAIFTESAGTAVNASGEYLFQHSNGRTFPGLIYSSVVREGNRKLGFRGIIVDISEQRRAQTALENSVAEKEIMLKEIHHRVKNNLQIISSLLNLQAAAIRDPYDLALFMESVDRIRSMALIHDRLYKSTDFAGIEFREYIESLVVSLFQSYGHPDVRFSADVQDVRLMIDMAIPCGLIINELVTNALKHAFPDRRRGRIAVTLRTCESGEVELSVADNGIGLPPDFDLSRSNSLGLHLVKILADQLLAKMEILRDGGTEFRIRLPRSLAPAEGTVSSSAASGEIVS